MVEKINSFSTITKYPYSNVNRNSTPSFKAQPDKPDSFEKKSLSTGAKIGIGSLMALGIAVLGDLIFAKGKHLKAIFMRGNKPQKAGDAAVETSAQAGAKPLETAGYTADKITELQETLWAKECEFVSLDKFNKKRLSVGTETAPFISKILGYLNNMEELTPQDIKRIVYSYMNAINNVFTLKFPSGDLKMKEALPSMGKETMLHSIGTETENISKAIEHSEKQIAALKSQTSLPGIKMCEVVDSIFHLEEWKKLREIGFQPEFKLDKVPEDGIIAECKRLLNGINKHLKQTLEEKGIKIEYYSGKAVEDAEGHYCFAPVADKSLPEQPLLIDGDTNLILTMGRYKE